MLLKVGAVMMLLSLALAAGVAATVGLRGGEPSETAILSSESSAAEVTTEEKRKPDPSQKTDRVVRKKSTQEAASEPRLEPMPTPDADEWPRPTMEELAASDSPRYYEPTSDAAMTLTIGALDVCCVDWE